MTIYKTHNDLVFAIAKRVAELGSQKMDQLRESNGFNCDTPYEARQKDKYKSRGEIMEEILIEEFIEEFDADIEQ